MSDWSNPLDEALDDALTSYGIAPENEGLEQRIQVRVTERALRARRMGRLAAAMGTTAVAAGLLCWWVTPTVTVQRQPPSKAALVLRKPEPLQERKIPLSDTESVVALATRPRSSSRKQQEKPKLSKFPIPSSVGSEERALLQLAKYKAKYATQELSYLGSPVTPIQIAAVEIEPIE